MDTKDEPLRIMASAARVSWLSTRISLLRDGDSLAGIESVNCGSSARVWVTDPSAQPVAGLRYPRTRPRSS
jgi:hypothetical protein